jgi:hypothetical protein
LKAERRTRTGPAWSGAARPLCVHGREAQVTPRESTFDPVGTRSRVIRRGTSKNVGLGSGWRKRGPESNPSGCLSPGREGRDVPPSRRRWWWFRLPKFAQLYSAYVNPIVEFPRLAGQPRTALQAKGGVAPCRCRGGQAFDPKRIVNTQPPSPAEGGGQKWPFCVTL